MTDINAPVDRRSLNHAVWFATEAMERCIAYLRDSSAEKDSTWTEELLFTALEKLHTAAR